MIRGTTFQRNNAVVDKECEKRGGFLAMPKTPALNNLYSILLDSYQTTMSGYACRCGTGRCATRSMPIGIRRPFTHWDDGDNGKL